MLAAWQGKVSELLSQVPGCSRTTCFISFEAEYDAAAAPEPDVAASPGNATANATAPVWRKGRDLKVDVKAVPGRISDGDGSGDGGREGRIATSPSSARQESGQQGSSQVQRSEWQAWLAPFKQMQLEPVQVQGGWRDRGGGKGEGEEVRRQGCR